MIRRNKFDLFLLVVLIFTLFVMLKECFSPSAARIRLTGVYKTKSPDNNERVTELSSKANISALKISAPGGPTAWFPAGSMFANRPHRGGPPKKIAQSRPSILKTGEPPGFLKGTEIPKIIWQKWKNRIDLTNVWRQDDYVREGWMTWQVFNKEFEHVVFSDVDAELFVRKEYSHRPDIVKVFTEIQQRIIAFDLLRYLVIYKYGGIYNDMDTMCRRPIDSWFDDFWDYGIVVGIECTLPLDPGLPEDLQLDNFNLVYAVQFLQWTVMAAPGHPVINRTIEQLVASVINDTREDDGSVQWEIGDLWYEPMAILNVSGPGLWTRTVKHYINEQEGRIVADAEYAAMWDIEIFGDLLLLPQAKWAPTNSGQQDEVAFLRHFWRGSWR
ncbi:membrane-bound alpha-1,6- mannosyltransferase Initiation-specific [Orbilia oligospora]|nr:membrane-bound alpha-1,6- mannosyltransferase Initiation-specific [Orbilia oligospora]KAF3244874.1 membrane-bound alpha-1,6- mannosyltransferase Initiation-specific [Orbilia oligospora]KAF3250150.1 membrane-bound alpha-1,6- mannosyltransferase Initiation-specific [Orbilia oligospora]